MSDAPSGGVTTPEPAVEPDGSSPHTTGRTPAPAGVDDVLRLLISSDDETVVALLAARPDLALPPPSSLSALAGRIASRVSVDRALRRLDRPRLAVAEALVALSRIGEVTSKDLARAVGLGIRATEALVADLHVLALAVENRPVHALTEALGPHPARLGPPAAHLPSPRPAPASEAMPSSVTELDEILAEAPAGTHRVLRALATDGPVGTVRERTLPPGTAWLLRQGLLRRLSAAQVILPMEIGLLLRGGRTHPDLPPAPDPGTAERRDPVSVSAEAAHRAEEFCRMTAAVLQEVTAEAPAVLRSGGLGRRELRRLAIRCDLDADHVALVLEVAGSAGLLREVDRGDDGSVFGPSASSQVWTSWELADRWAHLATAWLASSRAGWLVGTRDDHGRPRAPLEPGLERGWVAPLRRDVLGRLATLPPGGVWSASEVHAALTWHRPRATPPEASVAAVLAEAEILGLTGAGALAEPARMLVGANTTAGEVPEARGADDVRAAAAALETALPATVDQILLQADLTGIVPGRPSPSLAALLETCAQIESRGAALTVRFTAASIRHGLDSGLDAEQIRDGLHESSATGVPQALDYLIDDTARLRMRVQVGAARSFVRTDDPATAAQLRGDARLTLLGLRELAPTVLISASPPSDVHHVLQEAGYGPVLDTTGVSHVGGDLLTRGLGRASGGPGEQGAVPRHPGDLTAGGLTRWAGTGERPVTRRRPGDDDRAELVRRLRSAREPGSRGAGASGRGVTDPVAMTAALREAAGSGAPVVVTVADSDGRTRRRTVRITRADTGRVRMVAEGEETEAVVALHRVARVDPAD